ncbi:MAG TPA: ABC transporter ATP-binding protein [Bryobacteraceae bacterium]|nr:ABC transporter ATP-binding protein [Bryobacteraceae bacterium]
MSGAGLEVTNVSKDYVTGAGPLRVLAGVNLRLVPGDAIAVMGPSGSGKSTLLHILGALDAPTSGTVTLNGVDPFTLNQREQAAFRNRHIGFVFQDHALLPQCTVLENVLVPTLVNRDRTADTGARELLDRVGLAARIYHLPAQLSGGEKQRVALARALIRQPDLVLGDEPTGNLDAASAETVARLLLDIGRNRMLVIVTHSAALAAHFSQRFELREGTLVRAQ